MAWAKGHCLPTPNFSLWSHKHLLYPLTYKSLFVLFQKSLIFSFDLSKSHLNFAFPSLNVWYSMSCKKIKEKQGKETLAILYQNL